MLSFVTRSVEKTIMGLGVFGGILTFFIMIMVLADVIGRALFNAPVAGSTEVSVLLMIGLIFMGMPAAQQQGYHFRIDFLTSALRGAPLRVLKLFNFAVCIALTGLLTYLSGRLALRSIASGEVSYGTVAFPIWPSRALISLGLGFLTVQFAIHLVQALRGIEPVASDKTGAH